MRAFVFLLLGLVLATGPVSAAGVDWKSDLPGAKLESLKSGKPVLLFFHASWCGPCHQMEQDTFSNTGVQAELQKMVCVKIDVDQHPDYAQAFSVDGIPRVILLPPGGGTPIFDTTGYEGPQDFLNDLGQAEHAPASKASVAAAAQPDLIAVKEALANNAYPALKVKNAKATQHGLTLLVDQLGVFEESDLSPLIGLLGSAGDDGVSALITGMESPSLAVRAGSYRALMTILKSRHTAPSLTYDPWANATVRKQYVGRWQAWWAEQGRRAPQGVRVSRT